MVRVYAVQYRWPGNEWEFYNHSVADYTLEGARDEMANMKAKEIVDFPLDTIRMEYRVMSITYAPVDGE